MPEYLKEPQLQTSCRASIPLRRTTNARYVIHTVTFVRVFVKGTFCSIPQDYSLVLSLSNLHSSILHSRKIMKMWKIREQAIEIDES